MKFNAISTGLAACALAVFLSGCGKSEPVPPVTPTSVPVATNQAAPVVAAPAADVAPTAAEVKPAVETIVTTTATTVEKTTTTTAQAVDTANTEAQSLIEKAKSFVTEKKYQEALNVINQLGALKLSADQQKVVDDLKTQIQNLMSNQTVSNAVNSVGNLLGK
jgi:hypothetical protein